MIYSNKQFRAKAVIACTENNIHIINECLKQRNMYDLVTYLPLSRCHTQHVFPLALALRNVIIIHTQLDKFCCNNHTMECGLKTKIGGEMSFVSN